MIIEVRKYFFTTCIAAAIAVLCLAAPSLRAQWVNVAPNLVPAEAQHVGALRFHAGVAWAGTTTLSNSTDTGKTWKSVPSFQSSSGITDIAIYDPKHVLVSTNGEGLFLTNDAGQTWKNIQLSGTGDFSQVAYNGSVSVIHALDATASILYTSLNGGVTWRQGATSSSISKGTPCFAIAADKTIYVLSYDGTQGWINKSADLGQTWSGNSTFTDGDCNTIAADSCDNQRLYLINENVAENNRTGVFQSQIDLTTDAGVTWKTTNTHGFDYYNGSLASTGDVLYVGTVPGVPNGTGVQRSADSGTTWQNIRGPNEGFDTRSITAVNDNILLVLDQNGSVWRTLNSGGSPVGNPFSASPDTLFQTDTISCDSLTRTVFFKHRGCSPRSISALSIIGADSANFNLATVIPNGNFYFDSVFVTLHGVKQGGQNALLIILLDDSTSDTISLAGYVDITPSVLSLATQDVQTDTLGGTVSVPITINGLRRPENVQVVLHYNGTMDYLGSFSPTGVKLDAAGEQWPGRSLLQINGADPDTVDGFAKFNVFNDSNEDAHATFDSVNVLTASTCEYVLPQPVMSTITPPFGCGITILSQFIHLGVGPQFIVQPNPAATGNIWITSSEDLGDVTFAIYDMLGTERNEIVASVKQNNPVELPLPQSDGVYNIVVRYLNGESSVRVVRQR